MKSIDRIIEEVRRSGAAELPEHVLREAAEFMALDGELTEPLPPFQKQRLKRLAQLIHGLTSELTLEGPSPDSGKAASGGGSPLQAVAGRELIRRIASEVAEIRWHLDRQHEPLFSAEAYATEAVPWILATYARRTPFDSVVGDEARRLLQDGEEIANRLSDLTGESWSLAETANYLRFWDEDGDRRSMPVTRRNSEIWPLAEGTRRLHVATGFLQEDLVRFVLCGIEPRFPKAVTTLKRHWIDGGMHAPFSEPIRRDEVQVRILSPDLTAEDLHALTEHIRGRWMTGHASKTATRERLEDADVWLHEILRDRTDYPALPGKRLPKGFWTAVAKEWVTRGHDAVTPDALRVRAFYLKEKLDGLLPIFITDAGDTNGKA